jgi:signal transduction histidine kinase
VSFFERVSVRTRITVIATLVFGIGFAAAAIALVTTVRNDLEDRERSETTSALEDFAEQLASGMSPGQLRLRQLELSFQVFSDDGSYVAGSAPFADPLLTLLHGDDGGVRLVPNEATLSSSVLVWESVGTPAGDFTVAVANPLSDLEQSLDTLEGILWIATPTLAAMVGIAVWLLVGRALRPVEAMRREVDDISATTLDRRIAVPDTDDEIARLARTMNTMLDRLEAASQAQLRFVSDASHELRSPVSSIRTELEVARRTDGTDWDAVSERVLREDERLAELIDDLLTLARLDEGATARREPVDLDDLVLEEAARTSRVPVRADAVTAARVEGDPRQLARMLRNLVDNATRHARSEVRLVLQCDDGVVVLDVHDDGSGVPPDDRERVFDRFTRLEPSRDRDLGGTGLGLTVVRAVAEAHGGTVHVDDSPLGGARFAVRLPAAT